MTKRLPRWFAVVLVLLSASVAFAQAPPKAATVEIYPSDGRFVAFFIASDPGEWIAFPINDELAIEPKIVEGGKVCHFLGTAGKYRVYYKQTGQMTWKPLSVTLGGSVTPPGPGPVPNPPTPGPLPPPKGLWAVVVEETKQRTPEYAQLLLGQSKFRTLLTQTRLALVDQNAELSANLASYQNLAKEAVASRGLKLPILYLTDDTGKVYFEGVLPADDGVATAIVERVKGGGQ